MAAFTQPSSAPMDTVDTSSPKSYSIVVPKLARSSSSNGLTRAVHTWMSNGDLSRVIPSKTFHRPAPLSKSRSTRTTFDGLFSNKMCPVPCQEINETSKSRVSAQVTKPAPTASLVRSSLLKVNKTQLLLPDYLLERLVSTNPAISALIQNQKTATSQRPSRRSSPSSSSPSLPNVSSNNFLIQQ
jgi:hypothetical protein